MRSRRRPELRGVLAVIGRRSPRFAVAIFVAVRETDDELDPRVGPATLAGPRRRRASGRLDRAAPDRRAADAVGRAAGRQGRGTRPRTTSGAGRRRPSPCSSRCSRCSPRAGSAFGPTSATPACSTASRRSSTRVRSPCSGRRARGRGRLPGARRLSGDRLGAGARARAAARAPACTLPGLRRPRADDRAARHRRRPQAALPRRPRRPGARPRRRRRRRPTRRRTRRSRPTVERHGTQMAGLLVGSGGPGGLQGVAPGATVFPIRVAGWQPDAEGRSVVYARTDQLIAGLDRAVDPDGDGDAHDAARVALVGVAEPFASFADSPESQAVAGALALDTLVVAPAGNDGAAGPLYGSLAGPGRLRRPRSPSVRPTSGRRRRRCTSSCAAASTSSSTSGCRCSPPRAVEPARARASPCRAASGATVEDWFDRRGFSLVAGRAALVPAGRGPGRGRARRRPRRARARCSSTARACRRARSGSRASSASRSSRCRRRPARALLPARAQGYDVAVALGAHLHRARTPALNRVAPFSSRGLSFGGARQARPHRARNRARHLRPGLGAPTASPRSRA